LVDDTCYWLWLYDYINFHLQELAGNFENEISFYKNWDLQMDGPQAWSKNDFFLDPSTSRSKFSLSIAQQVFQGLNDNNANAKSQIAIDENSHAICERQITQDSSTTTHEIIHSLTD
jgi:hypothetical protein